ncbi:MAG TPA: alpha/beta hydrolase [Bryobacteraceae bacterium]|nr:alpha/beta hydrolase [Bryobacteraceae bacterium]
MTPTLTESKSRRSSPVLKWVKRILLAILILVVGTLTVSWLFAVARERQTAEQAAPASGRFVSAGDVRIYIQEDGPPSGLPVVFIHGFGAWSETWKKTTSILAAQGFHTIAVDVPPFGFSEKPTDGSFSTEQQARRIINVFDALQLKQVILVGHSVGGRPTVEVALLAPDRIRALVLVDVALGFGSDGQFEENHPSFLTRAFYAARPFRNAVLSATATNSLMTKKLLSTFVADPNVLTPALLSVYQRPFVVKDATNRLGDWLRVLSVDKDISLTSKLSNLSNLAMTTLLIWGDKDSVTPLWQGEKLKQTIPNSTLNVLKGLGHIPQIEGPDQFNNSLLPFLDQFGR